jgi:hypothetical protein
MLESHGGQAVFGPVELNVTMELLASEEWQSDCYALDCMSDGECAYTLMDQAAQSGSVEVARWLHEAHGLPFTDITMVQASMGRVPMLQWLHEAGAPCDMARLDRDAVRFSSWSCPQHMQWLCAHGGGQWSAQQLQELMRGALRSNRRPLVQWLRARGVPWPANLAGICHGLMVSRDRLVAL